MHRISLKIFILYKQFTYIPIVPSVRQKGNELVTKIIQRSMKNQSHRTDISSEMITSLLTEGIIMGKISKMAWLLELVKHAVRADCLYFLHLLLLSIYEP
jgi:hypothetical protein